MRADVASYALLTPGSLDEALALLSREPALRPLAGGTDLMVLFASGKLAPRRLLNLWPLQELRGVEVTEEAVTLGALTTYSQVQAHPLLREEFPLLRQAASETGGWAIQNRGTLGGNIANASPAADSPPALLCYDAELELRREGAARWVSYAGFHTGYKQTIAAPGELITRVRLPRHRASDGPRLHCYRKVGPRRAQAISKVCFAACVDFAGGRPRAARVALGGVAPVVLRCPETEAVLLRAAAPAELDGAAAAAALRREIAPIDDVRSTARYRRQVAENLLRQLVDDLRGHAGWHGPAA